MKKRQITTIQLIGLIGMAYIFSFTIRMIWIYQFQDNPNFYWNGQLMINTNDGYYFASGVQNALWDSHATNPRIPDIFEYGLVFLSAFLTKITPFSLETIILFLPAIISSLVVIPIILIARLYGESLWGFFAALLGSIAWSYYNRTMIGYYDTDMFSAMAPMFILYFLMKSTIEFNLRVALYAGVAIAVYPFLYDQGKAIVYAMGIIYAVYMLYYHRNEDTTYQSLILIFIALLPFPIIAPLSYLVKVLILFAGYLLLKKIPIEQKKLMIISLILFILFMIFGNVLSLILNKAMNYLSTGTSNEGLHFYAVVQTVREAGHIPFTTFANRISGSQLGVLISLLGYIVLVVKHRAFILALPLIGIGMFALIGGLRFTVYAVPIAAMSAIYLFHVITQIISNKKSIYLLAMTGMTALMIYPNITHIMGYKVPTVLNKTEVQDLVKLNEISKPIDYTLSWWDYGYPIWYYSDTSTLIDGGKHHNDNFIISKIMFSTSPNQVVNLSRLAVETYTNNNYPVVANKIFKDINPNLLLKELESPNFKLPKKTREIYLYMPYRMMNIFPTVGVFSNLNLKTGKKERNIYFYPTRIIKQNGSQLVFANGVVFDVRKGILKFGKKIMKVYKFDIVEYHLNGKSIRQSEVKHIDGQLCVVYLKSYGTIIVMDKETYNSAYVQMFMLDNYDKNLFDLVVSSPYSKIFKVKK